MAQLVVTARDVGPIELSSCLPCILRWGGSLLHPQGEGQAGASGPQEDLHHIAFTQVNSEDKGALAKLLETIRTDYDDRYDEIYHHRGGDIWVQT